MTFPIYLTNWASLRSAGYRGTGRVWSIMARPRAWERGDGRLWIFVPPTPALLAVKAGAMGWPEYEAVFREGVASMMTAGESIAPGALRADVGPPHVSRPVAAGDTLCCSCARTAPCHRQIVAELMIDAGWRVVLDGVQRGRGWKAP